ncbi:MAG: hypothetical protein M1818_007291 [Claussenomyces sp. TS43310]|nr:MAG: hypothetical protein M1818_007291 [Claussenomyces sp. TS43310]
MSIDLESESSFRKLGHCVDKLHQRHRLEDLELEKQLRDQYGVAKLLGELRQYDADLEMRRGSEIHDSIRQIRPLQAKLNQLNVEWQNLKTTIANIDRESAERQQDLQRTAAAERTGLTTSLEYAQSQYECEKVKRYESIREKRQEEIDQTKQAFLKQFDRHFVATSTGHATSSTGRSVSVEISPITAYARDDHIPSSTETTYRIKSTTPHTIVIQQPTETPPDDGVLPGPHATDPGAIPKTAQSSSMAYRADLTSVSSRVVHDEHTCGPQANGSNLPILNSESVADPKNIPSAAGTHQSAISPPGTGLGTVHPNLQANCSHTCNTLPPMASRVLKGPSRPHCEVRASPVEPELSRSNDMQDSTLNPQSAPDLGTNARTAVRTKGSQSPVGRKEKIVFKVSRGGIFTSPAMMKGVPLAKLRDSKKASAYWDPRWRTGEELMKDEEKQAEDEAARLQKKYERGERPNMTDLEQRAKVARATALRVKRSRELLTWVSNFGTHPNQILNKENIPAKGLLDGCCMVAYKFAMTKLTAAKQAGKIHARPSTWYRRRLIRKIQECQSFGENLQLSHIISNFRTDKKFQNVLSALDDGVVVDDSDDMPEDYESGLDDGSSDSDSECDKVIDKRFSSEASKPNSHSIRMSIPDGTLKRSVTEARLSPSGRDSKTRRHTQAHDRHSRDASVIDITDEPTSPVPFGNKTSEQPPGKTVESSATSTFESARVSEEGGHEPSQKVVAASMSSDGVSKANPVRKAPMISSKTTCNGDISRAIPMCESSDNDAWRSHHATETPRAKSATSSSPRLTSATAAIKISFTLTFLHCGAAKPWGRDAITLRLNAIARCFEPFDKNDSPLKHFHDGKLVIAADWIKGLKYITTHHQGDSVALQKFPIIGQHQGMILGLGFQNTFEADHFSSILTKYNEKIEMSEPDKRRLELFHARPPHQSICDRGPAGEQQTDESRKI